MGHIAAAKAALIPLPLMPALKCRPIKYVDFSAASEEGAEKSKTHIAAAKAALIPLPLMPAPKCRPIKYVGFSVASKAQFIANGA
jgi:hypothetical protein